MVTFKDFDLKMRKKWGNTCAKNGSRNGREKMFADKERQKGHQRLKKSIDYLLSRTIKKKKILLQLLCSVGVHQ